MKNATEFKTALVAAIDARKAFEADKSAENANIQKTLDDIKKSVDHIKICETMFANNVDANLIMRKERVSDCFNVYAYQKVVNIARAANAAQALNHYTRAILLTAKAFANADMLLSHDDAKSACTLSHKVKDSKREKLINKYQKHVALSTANTQSSSSVNALQAYNVLIEKRDNANNVVYSLNTENELTHKLLAMCE